MSEQPQQPHVSRRKAIAGIGLSGAALAQYATTALAQENTMNEENITVTRYATTHALKSQTTHKEGEWVETIGFHIPGDGGAALYHIEKHNKETQPNGADRVDLGNNWVAILHESKAVNYKMFGAIGDGENNDGVQIKLAHEYANTHHVPVVNLSGEYWIQDTHNIPILTNVSWGQTTLHINEKFNSKRQPRFVVQNDNPKKDLSQDQALKSALLEKLKPGVQLIPELAAYAGHLFTVEDEGDRIGIRAGNYSKRGWAREELFYVEEEGRIIGDIAWEFKNLTEITATPCNDNYLIIEGGGFYFSGDSGNEDSKGYHHHGFSVQRSRTIIREQWMGLEKGNRDISMEPRRGFYSFSGVYDTALENIRAMPWEKNRTDKDKVLAAGTYGIGGARMLNCAFRNLTAEGGWVAWGVFGTNLNKNFRVDNCRLNRIDVHFHCWNLHISNCTIGFKGIALTGGGNLLIENTTREGNNFVNFRRDYGAKWDGNIHIRGCRLKPSGKGRVSVLSYRPSDFEYQYPIGFGKTIKVEDLVIDYSAAPDSTASCWIMNNVSFSKTENNDRLFFPTHIEFRNITVQGRELGVRLLRLPSPHHYDLRSNGVYDGNQLHENCTMVFDNVQLEKLPPADLTDEEDDPMHLVIGDDNEQDYADALALYPKIRFSDCNNVTVYLGHCIASTTFERCTINTVQAPNLRGALNFTDCHFAPNIETLPESINEVQSTLGTRFTNCTVHSPIINGKSEPDKVNQIGFVEINKSVKHYHLNTALGNDVLNHLKETGRSLTPDFIAKLKSHHELEG
ncbi:MAG: hypothetical protein HOE48_04650 [Candidatus Latescibacteria bacterium]|nr:hypothetical protein [Candidatus Latescibacterota bacterium]